MTTHDKKSLKGMSKAEAMRAHRRPLQEQKRKEREARAQDFRYWVKWAKEDVLPDSAPLADRICEVLDAHEEYDRQVRRLLDDKVHLPQASSVFWLGVAFGELGVPWCSGTLALHICGYEREALAVLEQAALFEENRLRVAEFLKWRNVSPVEFPERRPWHRCAFATRSFSPGESEIFQRINLLEESSKKRELDTLSLAAAIFDGKVNGTVNKNSRRRIVEAILRDWCRDYPDGDTFLQSFGYLTPPPWLKRQLLEENAQ